MERNSENFYMGRRTKMEKERKITTKFLFISQKTHQNSKVATSIE